MSNNKRNKSIQQKKPEQVKITMYDVGFGDCFLLTFSYAGGEKRHVLIDCGSSSEKKEHMTKVVDQLFKDSEGSVDAIVVTHRHKDHLSAFGLKGPGEKLGKLNPKIVIQPWTEHPEAKEEDLKPPTVFTGAVRHLKSPSAAQEFANYLVNYSDKILAAAGSRTLSQITRLASLDIENKEAILQLNKMCKKHAYVYNGSKSGLEKLLPGVRVSVLGPPTLAQTETIRSQTQRHKEEFWELFNRLAAKSESNLATAKGKSELFPRAQADPVAKSPSYVKWLIRKLDSAQLQNVQRIVRELDKALNNTSIILLFEIGDKALLFPGDAQLENWQYALEDQNLQKRLSKVEVYKVGHHGSTNATPRKKLWDLFKYRNTKKPRLISLLSTRKGHHSEVPRESLVNTLNSETELHSTEKFGRKLSEDYEIRI
ncbi:MAG: MBL fold metallo-hydrolase [candidate division Zixibacteria bacterium]|nr:MBL fold metallo-hydrolase [candidate division Zixibacteria bacterium]